MTAGKMTAEKLTTGLLASMTNLELAQVDPLVANLVVAREIPNQTGLDLLHYQQQLNALAEDFRSRYLPYWEPSFRHEPQHYRNEKRFFHVGMISQFLQQEVGVRYIPAQRELEQIRYTTPADLFLNGVLDTLQGTCGNMATLAIAIGLRMGWPVSLACVHSHYVLRHDDGDLVFNIETTAELESGFSAPEDHDLIEDYGIPPQAIQCGSDIRALTPRECLAVYVWQRARHYRDLASETGNDQWLARAESDLMLSRHLFPSYRQTHRAAAFQLALHADERFSPTEAGHINSYPQLAKEVYDYRQACQHASQNNGLPTNPHPTSQQSTSQQATNQQATHQPTTTGEPSLEFERLQDHVMESYTDSSKGIAAR